MNLYQSKWKKTLRSPDAARAWAVKKWMSFQLSHCPELSVTTENQLPWRTGALLRMTFPLGQSVCMSWVGAGSSFCLLLTLIKLRLQRQAGRLRLPGSVTRFPADLKSPRAAASIGTGRLAHLHAARAEGPGLQPVPRSMYWIMNTQQFTVGDITSRRPEI